MTLTEIAQLTEEQAKILLSKVLHPGASTRAIGSEIGASQSLVSRTLRSFGMTQPDDSHYVHENKASNGNLQGVDRLTYLTHLKSLESKVDRLLSVVNIDSGESTHTQNSTLAHDVLYPKRDPKKSTYVEALVPSLLEDKEEKIYKKEESSSQAIEAENWEPWADAEAALHEILETYPNKLNQAGARMAWAQMLTSATNPPKHARAMLENAKLLAEHAPRERIPYLPSARNFVAERFMDPWKQILKDWGVELDKPTGYRDIIHKVDVAETQARIGNEKAKAWLERQDHQAAKAALKRLGSLR